MPLTVTEKAAQLLKTIQTNQEEGDDKTLRLVQRDDGFELTFDMANDSDEVFQAEGTDVLLVAPDVAELLADAIIDAQDSSEGPQLTLSSASEE